MTHVPFTSALGIQSRSLPGGRARSTVTVSPDHANGFGRVHGGLLYTLADTSMGWALADRLAEGDRCATVSATVQYVASPEPGELSAEGAVLSQRGSLVWCRCDVLDAEGTLCATATGLFHISNRRTS